VGKLERRKGGEGGVKRSGFQEGQIFAWHKVRSGGTLGMKNGGVEGGKGRVERRCREEQYHSGYERWWDTGNEEWRCGGNWTYPNKWDGGGEKEVDLPRWTYPNNWDGGGERDLDLPKQVGWGRWTYPNKCEGLGQS
jgi:hypothetical protein